MTPNSFGRLLSVSLMLVTIPAHTVIIIVKYIAGIINTVNANHEGELGEHLVSTKNSESD